MKTLYIIGNGFDRAHDMETSYDHFHKWLCMHYKDYCDAIYFADSIDVAKNKKSLWKQFEEGMGIINLIRYINGLKEDYVETQDTETAKGDSFYAGIEYVVKDQYKKLIVAFREWAMNLDTEYYEPEFNYIKQGDNYFFTFNYTDTLENVYGIPDARIMHIHGYAHDNKSTIQVGHTHDYLDNRDEILTILDKFLMTDIEDSCDKLIEALNSSIKPVSEIIHTNEPYFKQLFALGIEKIIVLGHGYGEIDWPYFEKIKSVCPNAQWDMTWSTCDDYQNARDLCKYLSLSKITYTQTSSNPKKACACWKVMKPFLESWHKNRK